MIPNARCRSASPSDERTGNRHHFVRHPVAVDTPRVDEDRARALVRSWAQEMLDGTLSPYEGSRLIWWRGWNVLGRPDDLTVFVGLASEWEDDPESRAE